MQQIHSSSSPTIVRRCVIFDTSAHNRFERGGKDTERIIELVRERRFVRIAGMSIEEMVGTKDTRLRGSLFTCSEKLIAGAETDTLMPPNELIKSLVREHFQNARCFDWNAVNVQAADYHNEITQRTVIFDEKLCAEQREQFRQLDKQQRQMWSGLRPKLDEFFAANPTTERPRRFEDAVKIAEGGDQSLVLGLAQIFYEPVVQWKVSRFAVGEFMAACPPFRAMVYSNLIPWYDRAVRDRHLGERFTAGRADLQMSAYLPYCNEFVTDEVKGEQARCLKKIARAASIPTDVLSYDEFVSRLLAEVSERVPVAAEQRPETVADPSYGKGARSADGSRNSPSPHEGDHLFHLLLKG